MDKRIRLVVSALRVPAALVIVSAAFGMYVASRAEEALGDRASRSDVTKPAAGKSTSTAPEGAQLQRKVDQILTTQQEILRKLDEQHAAVMEELRIVKVRATIRSGS